MVVTCVDKGTRIAPKILRMSTIEPAKEFGCHWKYQTNLVPSVYRKTGIKFEMVMLISDLFKRQQILSSACLKCRLVPTEYLFSKKEVGLYYFLENWTWTMWLPLIDEHAMLIDSLKNWEASQDVLSWNGTMTGLILACGTRLISVPTKWISAYDWVPDRISVVA